MTGTTNIASLTVVAALALGLAGSPSAAAASNPAAGSHALAVTGFQEESDPVSRITASASALTTVGVDGVDISPAGSRVGRPDAAARRQLTTAHHDHLRAELLIGNWDNAISDFSEGYAHRLLSSPSHISTVTRELAHAVKTEGWNGVSVDLESLRSRDRSGLTRFLIALRQALPAGKTLTMCVTNYTAAAQYRSAGDDLAAIAKTVSQIVLMAYDEHGPWENTPGPIGALRWQRAGLKVVLRSMPASKIDLGVAGYGYAWRPHSNDQLSDAQARRLIARDHATAHFDTKVGEWTAHLSDGSTLWWSDARSYALRVTLARREHLHGLAIWSLGLSDPIR